MESFDPREGFFNGESAGQKVQRVLYTFTKDDMTLSDIAQMVVDTNEHAAYDKITWEDDAFWNM